MSARLVFITGASSGIGQALAVRFHRAGYRLALVARRTAEVEAWAQAQGWVANEVAVYAATCATPPASRRPAAPASRRRACPTW